MPTAVRNYVKKNRPKKRVIIKGIPLNIKKINSSIKFNAKTAVKAQKRMAEITGYTLNDFMQAYGRPKLVGSSGFLTYSIQPKFESKKNERVILVGGVAVPFHKRKKGYRVALQRELLKKVYSRFGELVKKDKNVFIQTQISSKDYASLRTLTLRLGYAIFKQYPEQGIIVLRKKLDSKEMETFVSKKKSFL